MYYTVNLGLKKSMKARSPKFRAGDVSAYLFDPDIYTDGGILAQGLMDTVQEKEAVEMLRKPTSPVKVLNKATRERSVHKRSFASKGKGYDVVRKPSSLDQRLSSLKVYVDDIPSPANYLVYQVY
ncbi:unnamed protein product [Linum tenue]|uniref:Uncharacterized protein n=1 Tax=Linum tenue TaxID=586396 RepID=A0AAV0L0I4_9ROSI|nr:unnamed protein product [Linum tenue]